MKHDGPWQAALSVLLFLAELFFWYAVGHLTYKLVLPHRPQLAVWLAVGAVLLVILLWAFFVAPKAVHRLALTARLIVVGAAALAVGIGLWAVDERAMGIGLIAATILVFGPGQLSA